MTWEVYALKWAGPLKSPGAVLMWNQDWDQQVERAYFVWCLLGPEGPVVVDAGVPPEGREGRDLPNYVSPAEMLARMGVDAGEVRHLVLTHLHWDHAGGMTLFPRARVYVQRTEYDFWTGHPAAKLPVFQLLGGPVVAEGLARTKAEGRLALLDGDAELLPGLDCLLAPGHSPGLMALRAQTAEGACVVGSDAGHTFRNYAQTWPSIFVTDMAQALLSMERVKAAAAAPRLCLPGHDLAMLEGYPRVAEDISRIA